MERLDNEDLSILFFFYDIVILLFCKRKVWNMVVFPKRQLTLRKIYRMLHFNMV